MSANRIARYVAAGLSGICLVNFTHRVGGDFWDFLLLIIGVGAFTFGPELDQ